MTNTVHSSLVQSTGTLVPSRHLHFKNVTTTYSVVLAIYDHSVYQNNSVATNRRLLSNASVRICASAL